MTKFIVKNVSYVFYTKILVGTTYTTHHLTLLNFFDHSKTEENFAVCSLKVAWNALVPIILGRPTFFMD